VLVSKHKQPASSDQVTTELFPHHAARRSLGFVAAMLVFWRLFEAFQCLAQAARTDTLAGADTELAKRLRAPPMRRMLAHRYVTVLTCALLYVNLFYILMIHLSIEKPSPVDPSKKVTQSAPSSYANSVAPSVGVIGFTTLSAAEAWDFYQQTAKFFEGFKSREADQQGNPLLLHYFFLSISLSDLQPSLFAVLADDLKAAQKELSDEKSAQLEAENSLAEEKAARQAAEQTLQ
jgi:hypothetical protein